MRVLLVEDDPEISRFIVRGLTEERHLVDLVTDGPSAVEVAAAEEYDVVILDVMLPGADGFEVCRRMRQQGLDVPVIMLTARDAVADRITGLDEGADDYLVKPFAFPELLARVRALLRRDGPNGTAVIQVGGLRLDTARFEAFHRDRPLNLTPKEFGVLHYLMTRPGNVVPAEELLEHVWDEHTDPFTNTVRVTVGTLRRKLGVDGLIETVIGKGYRLREDR